MTETNDTCVYVDSFIADLLSGNIEIVYSRAKDLWAFRTEKGFLGSEKQKHQKPFPSVLGMSLTKYQENKNDPELRHAYAEICFQYIIWANTHQVVKRTGIVNKINELKKENAQLKEEKDKIEKENQRLKQLTEDLQSTFDRLGFQRIDDHADDDETGSGERP